jgi:hypothetical protein
MYALMSVLVNFVSFVDIILLFVKVLAYSLPPKVSLLWL